MGAHVLWAVVIGFLCGVFLRSFFVFGWYSIGFFILLAGMMGLAAFVARSTLRATILPTIFVLCFALGAARMHDAAFEGDPALAVWVDEKVVIEGVVVDEPDKRENNVRIAVRVSSVASTTVERNVAVLVVAPLHTVVAYGDRVRAEGELRLPESFDAGAGHVFNYPAYLAKDHIGYELSFAHVEYVGKASRNPLKAGAIGIKQKYLEGLAMALPEPAAGLAGGITAGDKRGLGDLSETFRVVGLIHIVVLSGYNIMVVIGFIERIFQKAHRYLRFSLGIGVAVFFALMTGLASSSVRAASMAVIATVGKASGRTYLASRALALVALLMVLWNPFVLAFDPGFQLSVLATFGLIYIAPLFVPKLGWITEHFGIRDTAAATLGTQAAVLPLLLYQSGLFSVYALPANLIALMAVPYAMLLSFIAGVFGIFLGPLAPIIGFPAYLLLTYITTVARFFAWLPYSAVSIPSFSVIWMGILYALLIALCAVVMKRSRSASRPLD